MTGKRLTSMFLTLALAAALCTGAYAGDDNRYPPYPLMEYQYSETVTTGTVRYMSQNSGSTYFYSDYWGKWADSAKHECLTASISMALSYIGIDKTPADILDYGGGTTMNTYAWGGSKYASPAFADAFNNYVNGAGRYSPPIIHLNNYSSGGHYVVVLGRVSDSVYQVADPFESEPWNITINGSTATYNYYGAKTDTIVQAMQYYYDNGGISNGETPQEQTAKIVFGIGSKTYTRDAEKKSTDVAPYIVGGYTYLPVYCVCSELGTGVAWDGASKTVTLTKNDTVLVLTIGSDVMTVNGSTVQLATAPQIKDGRTCLPISPITEAFGAAIAWNGAVRTVTITIV